MKENTITLSKNNMDILMKFGLDISDASLIYMNKNQYNVNNHEDYCEQLIKCKLGYYTYTLQDIYRRIEDLTMGTEYYMVIDSYSVKLENMSDDYIVHSEETDDTENKLLVAFNMLIWMLKNILGRKIKE